MAAQPAAPANRVTPPWQADDLVLPPSLRLVEPQVDPSAPQVRLVDDTALTSRIPKPRRTERAGSEPPATTTDLLIFASVSSAWFSGDDNDSETTWNSVMDIGWRAAEEASLRPSSRRRHQRRVCPAAYRRPTWCPAPRSRPERPLRIVRDAGEHRRAHQQLLPRLAPRQPGEPAGFAVGGRPGRESANGWDFSREQRHARRRPGSTATGPPTTAA